MTKQFDKFVDKIVKEITTAKSKRRESRYWENSPYPDSTIRKVRGSKRMSDSQKTKIDKTQQYVGDYWKEKGVRGRNRSEKTNDEIGIANGLGGHLKIQGVNPKKTGAKINSKQGHMVVKGVLPNNVVKVGSSGRTQFNNTKRVFSKER